MKHLTYILLAAVSLTLAAISINAWTDDGQFHLECLHDGEKMKILECHSTLCWVCQKNGYTYPSYRCAGLTPQCGTPGGASYDTEAPIIEINSPLEGQIFGSRRVQLEIRTDEEAQYSYADSQDLRERKLCSRCKFYSRAQNFNDGAHTLIVYAEDANHNKANSSVSFFIDSKKPRIRSTLPRKGAYTDGKFTVYYDETNLQEVLFRWRQAGDWNTVIGACPAGDRQSCTIEVQGLPQGTIQYHFVVRDPASNQTSSITEVKVDTVTPGIVASKPQPAAYSDRRVPFQIAATEKVTLGYIDLEDKTARYRRLCSSCEEYDRSQSFTNGFHRLVITATDNAGNSANTTTEFFVDSAAPRIVKMEPANRGFSNGKFSLTVMDDTLQEVALNYRETGQAAYTTIPMDAGLCEPEGRYMTCMLEVIGIAQGPLSYYFEATDKATTVQSLTYYVTVDTVAPAMTVHGPKEENYPSRNVLFNITSNEAATIGYTEAGRFTTLCRMCKRYERLRPFGYGEHAITLEATDAAGNKGQQAVSLTVESQ